MKEDWKSKGMEEKIVRKDKEKVEKSKKIETGMVTHPVTNQTQQSLTLLAESRTLPGGLGPVIFHK